MPADIPETVNHVQDGASRPAESGAETRWGGVVAEVRLRSEASHRGTLVDVARNVVEVDFLHSDSPVLPITERVRITFTGENLLQPFTAGARVISRAESEGSNLYGFTLNKEVGGVLSAALARRATFRVTPAAGEQVYVDLKSAGRVSRCSLSDISISGMAVLVGLQDEAALFDRSHFQLLFDLPFDIDTFELQGRVCNRRLTGNAVRYGIEFLPLGSAGFDAQQKRINRYVMRRQKAMLEERRSSKQ